MHPDYVAPVTGEALQDQGDRLLAAGGDFFPQRLTAAGIRVPDFVQRNLLGAAADQSLAMYDHDTATAIYRNFLDWLFATFETDEAAFRRALVARLGLRPGACVLVTGCGIGDDIAPVLEQIGPQGRVFGQDLSAGMALHTADRYADDPRVCVSVSDATRLPFADGRFDAVLHFGGINLFDDIGGAIREMARVTRDGGRVVFGDEGIAPWLRDSDYGRMVITNNPLWASEAPLTRLPASAVDVDLSWVLGNCFYVIAFSVAAAGPYINPDVPHQGRRGGSMRTRYYGQLEGVSPALRAQVLEAARREGRSVHDWLEATLADRLGETRR